MIHFLLVSFRLQDVSLYILIHYDFASRFLKLCNDSNQVRRVVKIFKVYEVLLDAPRADEAVEDADASRLVVRSASTGTTEGLLADHGACAFFIVVHVAGCVAEPVGGSQEGLALAGEAGDWVIRDVVYIKNTMNAYMAPVSA